MTPLSVMKSRVKPIASAAAVETLEAYIESVRIVLELGLNDLGKPDQDLISRWKRSESYNRIEALGTVFSVYRLSGRWRSQRCAEEISHAKLKLLAICTSPAETQATYQWTLSEDKP